MEGRQMRRRREHGQLTPVMQPFAFAPPQSCFFQATSCLMLKALNDQPRPLLCPGFTTPHPQTRTLKSPESWSRGAGDVRLW